MRLGIDLGGTKIEALVIDDHGAERARRRIATPAHSCEAIVTAIAELVRELEREVGGCDVGIGTPGAISPETGVMKNSNTICLNGQPLRKLIGDALGREVRLTNDANCFALSEAVDGAGSEGRVVFGVIIGTGTGGGIVVDRRVHVGPNAVAGEWGHNPLPWSSDEGAACYCGKRGCIETWLSGAGMARDHLAHGGEALDAKQIASAAERGDAGAGATIARYRRRLAQSLASVINVLDPDVIVLGGGLSNIASLYADLPIADYVFSDSVRTPVRRAHHGDASGVRGAAWLWRAAGQPPRSSR